MTIKTRNQNQITIIEISRPERKNAITQAMYQQLSDALNAADADPNIRAIVLHGQPDLFTSGNDLGEFATTELAPDAAVFHFMHTMTLIQKPIIAAVTGIAVGVGTSLLLHCDLVYAADNAKFSLPFVNLGLCPEFAASLLLPRQAGYLNAAETLLLGEPFSAEDALEMRLVNRLLPPDAVIDYAISRAERFNRLPPDAVRTTKRLLRAAQQTQIHATIATEADDFRRLLKSDQAKEARNAFFDHRPPDFSRFN